MNAWTPDAARSAWAALAVALWLALWLIPWRQRRHGHIRPSGGGAQGEPILIAYASQSGQGAQWAERTAQQLASQGCAVRLLPLNRLNGAQLQGATRLLLVASTTGEGDAPDNAALFESRLMHAPQQLQKLQYGLVARGDRSYARFCGFGRRLNDWLQASGAGAAFAPLEADNDDPQVWQAWLQNCARFAGTSTLKGEAMTPAPGALSAPQAWRLQQRHVLNAGSPGAPVHHLVLQPLDAGAHWQAGDVVRIHLPAREGQAAAWREYSLASLPHEGRAELLVREVHRPDGSAGRGSGWLCRELALGDTLTLQLRSNPGFHGPAAERLLILIGNGTGLAGLAALLTAREQARHAGQAVAPAWLMFGERSASADRHWDSRLQAWRTQGLLQQLDRAFSREPGTAARYVQDLIAPQAAMLRDWVGRGAALYVCGQRQGMAQSVHRALEAVLGEEALAQLAASGRYRRDVY
ncbi:NADPH cytochrome P450 oxidoreductase family protein [Xenophilus arseniciresistens]|uniref:NADPH--hemoprotein reductase n=1 Tax=Xenophilus arseniciresistens TaxID=1283306 RepID=A0AAE3SZD9_9BURK|nr:NADPH cytochrome P450 oxidoreductase family protein [Xenophilus arseniciresistens]MDA7415761.1 NADPH cytochrome P450 oxidoreductase family protein [Xenophilus arseniciresistens]